MRLPLIIASLVAAGCGGGGVPPELYALVVDTVAVPANCFTIVPTTTVAKGPFGTVNVEVWDGPDGKAFLSTDGQLSFDMGNAPNVVVSAGEALEGTNGAMAWAFVGDRDITTTQGVTGFTQTVNSKAHISLSFPRASTGKGTLSLSSSTTCTGTGCGASTACSIDSIPLRSSRLAVEFERSP